MASTQDLNNQSNDTLLRLTQNTTLNQLELSSKKLDSGSGKIGYA